MNRDSILLTEDGHPIGDVIVADPVEPATAAVAVTVLDGTADDELSRSASASLTGSPDADVDIATMYPGYSDQDRRRKARTAYVVESRSIEDVAKLVDVPCRTVSMWIYDEQWDELVRKELAVQRSRSILELERFRTQQRLNVAKEQSEQAKEIRNAAMISIRLGQGSLKNNTEAWAAAAKVEQTAVGMGESGTVADLTKQDGKNDENGKRPLVVIYNGGLPPVRRHT